MRTRFLAAPVVVGASLVAAAVATHPATAAPAPEDHRAPWPKGILAPYTQVGVPTNDLRALQRFTGNPYFTLSFVTAGQGCNVAWSSGDALDSSKVTGQVADLRGQGGEVAVSVGGSSGTDPASACTSAADLQKQYQRVVDTYSLTHLDLNIEGTQMTDTAAIDRRNAAVAALERANPNLWVSYTIPTGKAGLTNEGKALLKNAHQHGVKLGIVNAMTMNYAEPGVEMGTAAINAGTALKSSIQEAYPGTSDSDAWQMVGVTPMIGQNDSPGEIFTVDDAKKVTAWAKEKHIGRLSYWSVERDSGKCAGNTTASPTCSGVAQQDWDYAKAFSAVYP